MLETTNRQTTETTDRLFECMDSSLIQTHYAHYEYELQVGEISKTESDDLGESPVLARYRPALLWTDKLRSKDIGKNMEAFGFELPKTCN